MTTSTLIANLTDQSIAPGSTPLYTTQLLDTAGNPMPGSALNTLTLTICNTSTGAIINSCQDVNILNTGRGTVDGSGNVAVQLLAADTAIQTPGDLFEYRSLVLTWTYNGGLNEGQHQANLLIQTLAGI